MADCESLRFGSVNFVGVNFENGIVFTEKGEMGCVAPSKLSSESTISWGANGHLDFRIKMDQKIASAEKNSSDTDRRKQLKMILNDCLFYMDQNGLTWLAKGFTPPQRPSNADLNQAPTLNSMTSLLESCAQRFESAMLHTPNLDQMQTELANAVSRILENQVKIVASNQNKMSATDVVMLVKEEVRKAFTRANITLKQNMMQDLKDFVEKSVKLAVEQATAQDSDVEFANGDSQSF